MICHGADGGGLTAASLISSRSYRSFSVLRNKIASTMPFDNPGACLDTETGSCATDVANFVFYVLQNGAPIPED
ncbi:MAG: hypothetical protein RLZZ385_1199 [Pseudomonadota bacterium]